MERRIILITGGARSGKSTYAERMALSLDDNPVYIATARVWDEEFSERVQRHKQRRGAQWENIEEEKILSSHKFKGRTILIDCVTLWATNFFFDNEMDIDAALEIMKNEFDKFTAQPNIYIFVTNEIGLGGVSDNVVQRRFTDLQGWINQYIATKADELYLMVCGQPMKVK